MSVLLLEYCQVRYPCSPTFALPSLRGTSIRVNTATVNASTALEHLESRPSPSLPSSRVETSTLETTWSSSPTRHPPHSASGMPYTPPSKSAAPTSPPGSPQATRRNSEPLPARAGLPRSSSYLTKHRRTPSALGLVRQGDGSSDTITPPGTSDDLKSMVVSSSIRQSPPPMMAGSGMPSGAIISPPDSLSGSDDEGLEMRGRNLTNLKELKDAVSHISLHRESSPNSAAQAASRSRPRAFAEGMHHSYSTGVLDSLGSQRHSLAISSTAPDAVSADSPLTASDEDSDVEKRAKPPMVRKKSGELVRPALRGASRQRPTSMPGTPTFSKAVHFDAHLEHVRHFLQVDRPLAVSAGSSPVDNLDSDSEYPFPSSEDECSRSRSPPVEWVLVTSNFPSDDLLRNSRPVRVERFWLSKDGKSLHGSIALANFAFQKQVTCRFTLDYWKTTSEVAAEYMGAIHPSGHDRWTFSIGLSEVANLEAKTLYLCVRYTVDGRDYWDNNRGRNFQIDFQKRYLRQNGKRGFQGTAPRTAGELPRSNRRSNASIKSRPMSMPVSLSSEFIDEARRTLEKSQDDFNGGNGSIKLKRSANKTRDDDVTGSVSSGRGHIFGRRYDFNASLNEAKQSSKSKDPKRTENGVNMATPQQLPFSASNGNDSPGNKDYTYDEIVNRFCFYGSKQTATRPAKPAAPSSTVGRYDGSDDSFGSMSDANQHSSPHVTSFHLTPESTTSPRAASPASAFSPRSGASPVSLPSHHAQLHDRFPFHPGAHAPKAIHG